MVNSNSKQHGGSHYSTPIQTWDFISANNIPYLDGNAIKYISRHHKKNGFEDLQKAAHYIQKMMEVYYAEELEMQAIGHMRNDV